MSSPRVAPPPSAASPRSPSRIPPPQAPGACPQLARAPPPWPSPAGRAGRGGGGGGPPDPPRGRAAPQPLEPLGHGEVVLVRRQLGRDFWIQGRPAEKKQEIQEREEGVQRHQ